MRETKLEVKKWGPSEKISLTSEILLCLPVNSFLNVLNFFYFFEFSLQFSLKLGHCS